ncbi:DUF1819 family protein [Robertmurraya andreesenii]|uniref:DUF1819 family protein n=1 Tax=Anoxybacillus andreesenii TaxID=1325932 RepID=A0ABT9V6R1_9BACL|nr:DUF1819 family protein [Robertmurraya andreesenii]MDQ0156525.1 hypothetical protein [Robertmurraya andreesenii]
MLEYSAGFTSEGWFQNEINIVLPLKIEGLPRSEILERVLEKNLFQLRSESSIKKRFQMVYRRTETFNTELAKLYINGSRLDQKALLLYSYLKCYRLPFEFFNEVILYNYRNNKPFIQNIDVEFFIERKESESEKVAGWRPETKKRLRSSILMFFKEGGMLQEENSDTFRIHPLHLSSRLKSYAIKHDQLLCLLSEVR